MVPNEPLSAPLEEARAAFSRQAWREAFEALSTEQGKAGLEAADCERLAVCAHLLGEDDASAAAWEAAHRAALDAEDHAGSARFTFWLAMSLMLRGQMAQAGGWLGRTERLIEESATECAASGYLLIPGLLGALEGGEPETARDLAVSATEIGARFGDSDLKALATLGHGQALIAMEETAAGTARLDEVMVSVTAREVGPITVGLVYCAVILECMQLFDFGRASEWTVALSTWCDEQPDLVPYRGQCLVHRSQLQQAAGDWPDATDSAAEACLRLADPPHPALGLAHYQQAELHRVAGAFDEAAVGYRQANHNGHQPMPGLALLELARGDSEAAAATVGRALREADNPTQRPALLAAAVEIRRVTGDLSGARAAAEELELTASSSSSDVLTALAAQAIGSVLISEGDAAIALGDLRAAATAWQALHMPYELARSSVLVGLACAALGDRASASLEFDNARDTFTALGAGPDLERLATLTGGVTSAPESDRDESAGLSPREREVLQQVAAGKTNREIAAALVISQHTVSRHLENIFTKLGVTSRAAATAYAYEHDLL